MLIAGEAGIGNTRLTAEEVFALSRAAGPRARRTGAVRRPAVFRPVWNDENPASD